MTFGVLDHFDLVLSRRCVEILALPEFP
jgi:hypothetical protein